MQTVTLLHSRNLILAATAALLAGCAAQPRLPSPPPQTPQQQPQPEQHKPGQAKPLPPRQQPQISQPQQPQHNQESQQAGQGEHAGNVARSPADISSPAVLALLDTADTLAQAGHMGRAASTLQRALNIEPRNPFVYQRLAAVRLVQGRPDQAEALAHKSSSVAPQNPFIQGTNWQLIAKARQTAGNEAGYHKAMRKVKLYRTRAAAYK